MSDRKKAIETLKQLRLDYEEFYEEHNNEVTQAYDMAIASLETDEAYQLEYERTTKNNLAVDAVSRQAVLDLINADWKYEGLEIEINSLPSVTPIRPKGHWINKDYLFNSCSAECSSCHKRSNGYQHDNGFSLDFKYYDFCPNCGSDNREVEE